MQTPLRTGAENVWATASQKLVPKLGSFSDPDSGDDERLQTVSYHFVVPQFWGHFPTPKLEPRKIKKQNKKNTPDPNLRDDTPQPQPP